MYAARRNRNRFRNLAKRDLSDLSLRRSGPLRPAPVRYLRFSDNANPLSSGNGGLPRLDSGAPLWCGSFDAGRGEVSAYGRQSSEEIPIQVVRKSTEIVDGTTRVKVEGRAGDAAARHPRPNIHVEVSRTAREALTAATRPFLPGEAIP